MQLMTISIVIPNYNHGHYLSKAVAHAANQSIPADEILIIDDGSTDNSLQVIQELQKQYPQLKILQNHGNQGVIYTINRGLHEAGSTHVLMAAADDWIEPTLIATAKQQLGLHPDAGLWSSGSWIAYENEPGKQIPARMLYPCNADSEHCYLTAQQAKDKLLNIDSWFMGNTLVLNREFALAENGYRSELKSFTDNFLYRVLVAKHGCCFSAQRLGTWQICKNSYANTFNVQPEKQLVVLEEVVKLMQQQQYMNIFSDKLITRTNQRMRFNLARTIWIQQQGHVSAELTSIINQTMTCNKLKAAAITGLKIAGNIPRFGLYLGQVILFIALRPFDIGNQLKIIAS